jgi:hypothetical protein
VDRNVLNIVLFVRLLLGPLRPGAHLLRPVCQLIPQRGREVDYRVDDLRVERVGDIEDCLFVDVG